MNRFIETIERSLRKETHSFSVEVYMANGHHVDAADLIDKVKSHEMLGSLVDDFDDRSVILRIPVFSTSGDGTTAMNIIDIYVEDEAPQVLISSGVDVFRPVSMLVELDEWGAFVFSPVENKAFESNLPILNDLVGAVAELIGPEKIDHFDLSSVGDTGLPLGTSQIARPGEPLMPSGDPPE